MNGKKTNEVEEDEDKIVCSRNHITILIIAFMLGVQTFPLLSMSYFFKDELKLGPSDLSFFDSFSTGIFVLKPVYGFISDSIPICGYKRKFYLIICAII